MFIQCLHVTINCHKIYFMQLIQYCGIWQLSPLMPNFNIQFFSQAFINVTCYIITLWDNSTNAVYSHAVYLPIFDVGNVYINNINWFEKVSLSSPDTCLQNLGTNAYGVHYLYNCKIIILYSHYLVCICQDFNVTAVMLINFIF